MSSMPAPCVPAAKVRSLSFFPASLLGTSVVMVTLEMPPIRSGVGNLVFSGSAGGPPERHAVYGGAVTVVTLPTASLKVLHNVRAQFADTHRGAVLRARGSAQPLVTAIAGPWAGVSFIGVEFATCRRRLCFLDGCCLRLDRRRFGCCPGRKCPLPIPASRATGHAIAFGVSRRFTRSRIRIQTHFAKVVADSRLHEAASCWVFDF